jgi:methionyl-tRNA formyltransferase
MRIVFMGTPEFARATLSTLCESRHDILAVVTGGDQPAGRGRKIIPTVCAATAEDQGIPVIKARSLKSDKLYERLKQLNADLFVVAAFRILPPRLFNLPLRGSINIHASLLPKYRGAAPINWAIINGETETGLTSFFLRESVDTGSMILQDRIPIYDNDTFDVVHDRLCSLAGAFTVKTLDAIEFGDYEPIEQDDSQASRAPKITQEDALIDWGFPAHHVRNFVRGLATRPGAYTYFKDKKLKIHLCREVDSAADSETRPGTIIQAKKRLIVQCGRSAVELLRVVPEGRKEMDGVSFINGYRPRLGDILGVLAEPVKE